MSDRPRYLSVYKALNRAEEVLSNPDLRDLRHQLHMTDAARERMQRNIAIIRNGGRDDFFIGQKIINSASRGYKPLEETPVRSLSGSITERLARIPEGATDDHVIGILRDIDSQVRAFPDWYATQGPEKKSVWHGKSMIDIGQSVAFRANTDNDIYRQYVGRHGIDDSMPAHKWPQVNWATNYWDKAPPSEHLPPKIQITPKERALLTKPVTGGIARPKILQLGSRGEDVRQLQKFMNQQFGANLAEDAHFGPLTQATVRAAQLTSGIRVNGKVDAQSRKAWDFPSLQQTHTDYGSMGSMQRQGITRPKTLQMGSRGEDVRQLQRFLNRQYGANLAEDGDFGLRTQAAVRAAQLAARIRVDGKVGGQSRTAWGWDPLRP